MQSSYLTTLIKFRFLGSIGNEIIKLPPGNKIIIPPLTDDQMDRLKSNKMRLIF
jgi:hypothetical protein